MFLCSRSFILIVLSTKRGGAKTFHPVVCTAQFQPDVREGSPGENGASKNVDAFVRALGGVEDGGFGGEAAPEGHAKG